MSDFLVKDLGWMDPWMFDKLWAVIHVKLDKILNELLVLAVVLSSINE